MCTPALVDILGIRKNLYPFGSRACRGQTVNCKQVSKAHLGPMLDRIDIHIEFPCVNYEKLSSNHLVEALHVVPVSFGSTSPR